MPAILNFPVAETDFIDIFNSFSENVATVLICFFEKTVRIFQEMHGF